eukprot:m.52267 g.52267  ORF g.52267 m.52267 type:complete len:123 (+) comp15398_c0_seq1:56-424(+)
MVTFGFIIKDEGGKFSATGTTEEAKTIEGAGDSFDAIFQDLKTKVKATDPSNGIRVGGGATRPKTWFVTISTGPAPTAGGGGGAAPAGGAAAGGGGGDAPAKEEAKKEESEEEEDMDFGLFD